MKPAITFCTLFLLPCTCLAMAAADADCRGMELHYAAEKGELNFITFCATRADPPADLNRLATDAVIQNGIQTSLGFAKKATQMVATAEAGALTICLDKAAADGDHFLAMFCPWLSNTQLASLLSRYSPLVDHYWDYDLNLLIVPSGKGQLQSSIAPLHVAVLHGQNLAVRKLIELGANPNVRRKNSFFTSEGPTPLQFAAIAGNAEAARILIDAGALINLANGRGQTPVMLAALDESDGHFDTLSFLLENGGDCSALHEYSDSVLYYAAGKKNWRAVHYLLERNCTSGATKALFFAMLDVKLDLMQRLDIMQRLVDAGADVNGIGELLPLNVAAYCDDLPAVQFLVNHGADPNAKGTCVTSTPKYCTAIVVAAVGNSYEVLVWLSAHLRDKENPGAGHEKNTDGAGSSAESSRAEL